MLTLGVEETHDPVGIIEYYICLRLLVQAYAYAGSHEVASQANAQVNVVFAPLSPNLQYADECLRIASGWRVSAPAALQALRDKDQMTRATMCQLMRQGLSQGEALGGALVEHAVEWKTPPFGRPHRGEELLAITDDTSGGGPGGGGSPGGEKRARKGKGKGKDKDTKRPKIFTAQQHGGRNICKAYNDVRGCGDERRCPAKGAHVCDVIMPNGKACGSKSHNRSSHPQPRWGR